MSKQPDIETMTIPSPHADKPELDEAYYAGLENVCEQQLEDAKLMTERFIVIVDELSKRHAQLEEALIAAWDDKTLYKQIKSQYEALLTEFDIAPKILKRHDQRRLKLMRQQTNIRSNKAQASVLARQAQADIERDERKAQEEAEQQAIRDERKSQEEARKQSESQAKRHKRAEKIKLDAEHVKRLGEWLKDVGK